MWRLLLPATRRGDGDRVPRLGEVWTLEPYEEVP